ncbi:MAG: branched-chain-amino-acid transaminase [Spirochaetales bacterium]|nr:branched-chain-amino-acid transaminase [Spirochaetales bacterium]
MAKSFSLAIYPWVYLAKYSKDKAWEEKYQEKPHLKMDEEVKLSDEDREQYIQKRNSFPELPLVNYTTQYGMGCFEGLKAFPQKDGSLKIFRPEENGKRMERSMEGLMMPAYPAEYFLKAVKEVVAKNAEIGFAPVYDPDWEKDDFIYGHAVYIRPFTYTEPGIGVAISSNPWVVIISTGVGSYFQGGTSKAFISNRVRAYPGGTGWIKCDANYVTSALAKREAESRGYMEAIFLDAQEHKYFEEGSSSNIFFILKDDTVVTPALQDTILPGITRKTILTLAKDKGLKVEERKIALEEAFSEAREVFVSGTAAGISFIESITYGDKTAVFNNGKIGEITHDFLKTLKGIQYGAIEDSYNWMTPVKS